MGGNWSAGRGLKRPHENTEPETETSTGDLSDSSVDLHTPKRKRFQSTAQYIVKKLFEEGTDSDVTIRALGKSWHLHRIYLSQCKYFDSMFSGQWLESEQPDIVIEITDENVDAEALRIAFKSLYTDNILVKPIQAVGVLAAATFLQLDPLIEHCRSVMNGCITCKTVCPFIAASECYGLLDVRDLCMNWLLRCLMVPKNAFMLSDIREELLVSLLDSRELWIMQVEVDIYCLLKKWVFTHLNPSWNGNSDQLYKDASDFYKLQAANNSCCFLETAEGGRFIHLFERVRWMYIINDSSCIQSLQDDQLLPYDWLNPVVRFCWNHHLRVEQGLDIGPMEVSEGDFYKWAMRCGRVLLHEQEYHWRWLGYTYGLDLLFTLRNRVLTISRNCGTSQRFPGSLSQQETRHVMLCIKVSPIKKKEVCAVISTGIKTLALQNDDTECFLMALSPAVKFPMQVTMQLLYMSPDPSKSVPSLAVPPRPVDIVASTPTPSTPAPPTPSTPAPSTPAAPTPTPSTPAPPTPSTPAPSTPAPPTPSTPAPSTPAAPTPAPSTPAPSTPTPPTPSTPAPSTPAAPPAPAAGSDRCAVRGTESGEVCGDGDSLLQSRADSPSDSSCGRWAGGGEQERGAGGAAGSQAQAAAACTQGSGASPGGGGDTPSGSSRPPRAVGGGGGTQDTACGQRGAQRLTDQSSAARQGTGAGSQRDSSAAANGGDLHRESVSGNDLQRDSSATGGNDLQRNSLATSGNDSSATGGNDLQRDSSAAGGNDSSAGRNDLQRDSSATDGNDSSASENDLQIDSSVTGGNDLQIDSSATDGNDSSASENDLQIDSSVTGGNDLQIDSSATGGNDLHRDSTATCGNDLQRDCSTAGGNDSSASVGFVETDDSSADEETLTASRTVKDSPTASSQSSQDGSSVPARPQSASFVSLMEDESRPLSSSSAVDVSAVELLFPSAIRPSYVLSSATAAVSTAVLPSAAPSACTKPLHRSVAGGAITAHTKSSVSLPSCVDLPSCSSWSSFMSRSHTDLQGPLATSRAPSHRSHTDLQGPLATSRAPSHRSYTDLQGPLATPRAPSHRSYTDLQGPLATPRAPSHRSYTDLQGPLATPRAPARRAYSDLHGPTGTSGVPSQQTPPTRAASRRVRRSARVRSRQMNRLE